MGEFRSGLLAFSSGDSCWDIIHHRGRGGYVRESISGLRPGQIDHVVIGKFGRICILRLFRDRGKFGAIGR